MTEQRVPSKSTGGAGGGLQAVAGIASAVACLGDRVGGRHPLGGRSCHAYTNLDPDHPTVRSYGAVWIGRR